MVSLAGCTLPETWAGDDYIGPLDRRPAARGERAGQAQLPKTPAVPPTGPLNVSITEAVLIGLENNRALIVERTNPPIRRTYEDQERAVFDPVLKAEAAASHAAGKTGAGGNFSTTSVGAGAAVAKRLPTGTDVEAGVTADQTRGAVSNNAVRAGLSVTQALLRGAGTDVNLASIRQARLDTLSSQYELRGFAEALVADIESTYWDHVLAKRQIEIYEKSLKLAGDQLKEAEQRVNVGKLAATDLAAARAEVALRQEALINARSLLDTTRLRLLRLTSPPGSGLWQREVALKDAPSTPSLKLDDVEDHARLALKTRPDLNEARLRVRRDELELVKTKNGLLPKLDLFVSLGKTGYADSFGSAAGDLGNEYYDVSAGLSFEIPFGNRDAKAQHRRAVLTRQQAADAVANMEQLVQVDVRSSHVEVKRSAQQAAATSATREAQEEKVRAETEKFLVGKSTSLLVATVQRDLVQSQIGEVQAVVNYLKALIDLYRLDGSLLERRGIATPGRDPAD
ncbi:MAG: TolC family protein [Planctomycetota bacterium]